jgi:ubiquinone/menaquinone biosynthesis C-methylase UbiE
MSHPFSDQSADETIKESLQSRLDREREFHDRLAENLDPASSFDGTGPLESALLERAGDIAGRSVLEIGCGAGGITLELIKRGAALTALDLSPKMIEVASRRVEVEAPDSPCRFVVAPVERTGLPTAGFELIVGRFILHHLDVPLAGSEMRRLLAPGGRVVLAENSARNRILMLARDLLVGHAGIPRYGSQDEQPLGAAHIRALRAIFSNVRLDYPVFQFFVLFDRQILRFRFVRASRVLQRADQLIYERLPRLRPYSFRVLITLRP